MNAIELHNLRIIFYFITATVRLYLLTNEKYMLYRAEFRSSGRVVI